MQDRRLKSYVEQNPFKSARQLKKEVAEWVMFRFAPSRIACKGSWACPPVGLQEALANLRHEEEEAGVCQKVQELECLSMAEYYVQ